MYLPPHFEQNDTNCLHHLISEYPFATWITLGVSGLLVNHLPLVLDTSHGEHGILLGHVARANPVWREFSTHTPSVVAFQGPQAYVTPSWYPGKKAHGKVVPTWNYAVVHVHGIPRLVEERDALLALLARLTEKHEAAFPAPWKISDAPAEFIEKTLQAIVGIEIPVQRIEGKWKLSQNRTAEDQAGVRAGLDARADEQARTLAQWMEKPASHW